MNSLVIETAYVRRHVTVLHCTRTSGHIWKSCAYCRAGAVFRVSSDSGGSRGSDMILENLLP
jgi:hypothetical protein